MSEKVKPALTAEEWADLNNAYQLRQKREGWHGGEPGREPIYYPTKHGIAAANLHAQPFGFTREMVEVIRDMARRYPTWVADFYGHADIAREAADRIAALLPPKETP